MDALAEEDGALAVRLARRTIESHILGLSSGVPDLPAVFSTQRGVFVTLKRGERLRGCIGFSEPVFPLKDALMKAAVAAATEDPRFPPVQPDELRQISVEVTVLTPPEPLSCAPAMRSSHIEPGRHGLIVSGMGRGGLLLPQVATEYGWDAITFLDQTCIKAGLPSGCWRQDNISVQIFEGQIFEE